MPRKSEVVMQLSPEERHKIYEEEKERIEAEQKQRMTTGGPHSAKNYRPPAPETILTMVTT